MAHEQKTRKEAPSGFIVTDYSKEIIDKLEAEAKELRKIVDYDALSILIQSLISPKPYVIVSDEEGLKVIYPSFFKLE